LRLDPSSAPILVDGAVVVGSASGNVCVLDAATGSEMWVGGAGAGIASPDEQNVSQPLTGLAAGEGYLVVIAGSRLTAWRITAP
jgi:outer membrane protein assembly factor BamB